MGNGIYGPVSVDGHYQCHFTAPSYEEANRLLGYLKRAHLVEKRLELAEAALREFAHHTQGIMAPNASYTAWREFVNYSSAPQDRSKPL